MDVNALGLVGYNPKKDSFLEVGSLSIDILTNFFKEFPGTS